MRHYLNMLKMLDYLCSMSVTHRIVEQYNLMVIFQYVEECDCVCVCQSLATDTVTVEI